MRTGGIIIIIKTKILIKCKNLKDVQLVELYQNYKMETEPALKADEKAPNTAEKTTDKANNNKASNNTSKPSEMKTSKSIRSMTRSASNSPAHKVPIQCDTLTFDNRHVQRIKEMEKYVVEEAKKRKKDWEKDVEQMREEFLHLVPTIAEEEPSLTVLHAIEKTEDLPSDKSKHLITRRKGSLDVLDNKKMKTLFMEYPGSGMRYKMRFDIAGFEPSSVKVGGWDGQMGGRWLVR